MPKTSDENIRMARALRKIQQAFSEAQDALAAAVIEAQGAVRELAEAMEADDE